MLVKTRFFHKELGMMAGRLRRSWRPTHRMKTGIRRREMRRVERVVGFLMLEESPVMELSAVRRVCVRWET
jgi:hypothetical protein